MSKLSSWSYTKNFSGQVRLHPVLLPGDAHHMYMSCSGVRFPQVDIERMAPVLMPRSSDEEDELPAPTAPEAVAASAPATVSGAASERR